MKYRKRLVVIHALRWSGDNAAEIKVFVGQRPGTDEPAFLLPQEAPDRGWDEPTCGPKRKEVGIAAPWATGSYAT